ncbi:unnamed protein product [Aphanomyces euteiches]
MAISANAPARSGDSAASVVIMESSSQGSMANLPSLHPFEMFLQTCKSMDLYDNAWRNDKPFDPLNDYVGALREGGLVQLIGRDYFGSCCRMRALAFYAHPLPNIGWGAKLILALCSDSIGFFSYRRKSYMAFGWFIAATACIVLSQLASSSKLVVYILASVAFFGSLMTKIAGDGLMNELSQRETIEERGHTALALQGVRWLSSSIASLFVCVAWHTSEIGASFNWTIDPTVVMLGLGILALVASLAVVFGLFESNLVPACEFRRRFHTCWRLIANRAIWQLCAFQLFSGMFAAMSATTSGFVPLPLLLAGHSSLESVVFQLLFAISIAFIKAQGMQWPWRTSFVAAAGANVLIEGIYLCHLVIADHSNVWISFATSAVQAFPTAMLCVLRILPVIEIAQTRYEATTFALVSSFGEFAHPLIIALINPTVDQGAEWPRLDDRTPMYIVLGLNLLGFLSVSILPFHRRDCLTLKHYGGYSHFISFMTLALYMILTVVCLALGNLNNMASRS